MYYFVSNKILLKVQLLTILFIFVYQSTFVELYFEESIGIIHLKATFPERTLKHENENAFKSERLEK